MDLISAPPGLTGLYAVTARAQESATNGWYVTANIYTTALGALATLQGAIGTLDCAAKTLSDLAQWNDRTMQDFTDTLRALAFTVEAAVCTVLGFIKPGTFHPMLHRATSDAHNVAVREGAKLQSRASALNTAEKQLQADRAEVANEKTMAEQTLREAQEARAAAAEDLNKAVAEREAAQGALDDLKKLAPEGGSVNLVQLTQNLAKGKGEVAKLNATINERETTIRELKATLQQLETKIASLERIVSEKTDAGAAR